MSFLNAFKNLLSDAPRTKSQKVDNDHNWWDATKNTVGDFATGGIGGVVGGEINRRRAARNDLPLLGTSVAPVAGVDALTPKPLLSLPLLGTPPAGSQTLPSVQGVPKIVDDLPPLTAPNKAFFPVVPDAPKVANNLPPLGTALTPDNTISTTNSLYTQGRGGNGFNFPVIQDAPKVVGDLPPLPPPPKFPQLGNAPAMELPDSQIMIAGTDALTPKPLLDLPSLGTAQTAPLTTGEKFQQAASNVEDVSTLPNVAPVSPLSESEKTANEMARIEGKKYGFQKDASGKILRDDKGKPIYEKDRDSDHNWWDVVKSAGIGFAKGGLPGAIGGAVGGAIDRNYDEKAIDEMKINRLGDKFANQTAREATQQGYQMRETQRKNIEHDNKRQDEQDALKQATGERNTLLRQLQLTKRYKRGENPEFDAKLEAANIEQPDFEPGKKLPPRFWDGNGQLKTYNESGGVEPVLEKGQPVFDESRANIYVNGYAVKGRDALAAETAAGVKNNQYGNSDDEDLTKWQNDVNEVNAFNSGVEGEARSKQQVAENLEVANKELEAQKAPLMSNPILNADAIKQIDGQINANKNAWRTAKAEAAALGSKKKPLPIKPAPRQRVTTPTVNNVGSYSETQFRRNFEGKYSNAEIEKLVATAKQQGIIK